MSQVKIEMGPDVKPELFQKYKTIVPDEVMEIWKEYGFGSILDGYMKFINPEEYQELLNDTYFRGNVSVPILVTAFGDIVTFEEGAYIGIVKYKECDFTLVSKKFKRFMLNLEDTYFLDKYLEIPQYTEALEKLGKLEYDECYGYVPLLGLGGKRNVDNLKKVKIREHIELISQMVGNVGM